MSHTFLLQYLVHSYEYAGFLHLAELVVDGGAEHAHGGTEAHVGVDQRRNVVAALAHLGVEYAVVGLEVVVYEEFGKLIGRGVDVQWLDGGDKAVLVAKVLVQEVEYHVACRTVERRIHGHLAKEVFEVGYDHRQGTESVPQVVECKKTLARGTCALIFEGDE